MTQPLELTFDEFVAVTAGEVLAPDGFNARPLTQLVYDSRAVLPGSAFLCVRGEKVDGHDFIKQAIASGAQMIVGDEREKIMLARREHPGTTFVIVNDVLRALHALSIIYRRKFAIPVIGIAGANGKTTTKDLAATILSLAGKTLFPVGSLNNHWGVPQTIMQLRPEHQVAVIELGTNHFGEVRALAALAQPTIGYITNIGKEHLEMLGDETGSFRANRELFDWMHQEQRNPLMIFNLDDPYLVKLHAELIRQVRGECLTISLGNKQAHLHLVDARPLDAKQFFGWRYRFDGRWGKIEGELPIPGRHNLHNALAGAALALASGVAEPKHVVAALAKPTISKFRSHLIKTESGLLIFDDCYNANPSSVGALLDTIRDIRVQPHAKVKRVFLVVGDMLELGGESAMFHRTTGEHAAKAGIDELLVTGQYASAWSEGFCEQATAQQKAQIFPDKKQVVEYLIAQLGNHPAGMMVVVKASRGVQMEEVVTALTSGQ